MYVTDSVELSLVILVVNTNSYGFILAYIYVKLGGELRFEQSHNIKYSGEFVEMAE